MLFVYLIIFIILSFYGLKLNKENFLEKETTINLRGISIMAILFAHFMIFYFNGEHSTNPIKYFFAIAAPVGVGTFFFLSAFGNYFSIQRQNSVKWLLNKTIRLYITVFFVLLIQFFIAKLIIVDNLLFPFWFTFIKHFAKLSLPGAMVWYLEVQVIAYITLFIYNKYKNYKHSEMAITIFWLLFSLYYIIFGKAGYGVSVMCLPIGLYIAKYKDELKTFFTKYCSQALFITLGLTILLFISTIYIHNWGILLLCSFIPVLITAFSCHVNIKSKVLNFLGKYSLEIYLVHLAIMSFLKLDLYKNMFCPEIKCLIVTLFTVATVPLLNIICKYTHKKLEVLYDNRLQ